MFAKYTTFTYLRVSLSKTQKLPCRVNGMSYNPLDNIFSVHIFFLLLLVVIFRTCLFILYEMDMDRFQETWITFQNITQEFKFFVYLFRQRSQLLPTFLYWFFFSYWEFTWSFNNEKKKTTGKHKLLLKLEKINLYLYTKCVSPDISFNIQRNSLKHDWLIYIVYQEKKT